MKNGKSNFGFSYIKNLANFEAFRWNFSSSTNPEIWRSGDFLTLSLRHPALKTHKNIYPEANLKTIAILSAATFFLSALHALEVY